MAGVTGDLTTQEAFHGKAAAIPFTVVAEADLSDATSQLNRTALSGKREGYGFVAKAADGTLGLYVATGTAPTDSWTKIGGAVDGTTGEPTENITPA